MFLHLVDFIFTVGLTLGVGSSTFALIFYIRALQDGIIDLSERRFMHTVYVVLRIGMALIFVGIIARFLFGDTTPATLIQLVLLAIITGNALLMHKGMMSMRYGPVLAGGSWYSLFFVTQTSVASFGAVTCTILYVLFLALFFVVYESCKRRFIPAHGRFRGEVVTDTKKLEPYATDASVFKMLPRAIYYPKDVADVQTVITLCKENRKIGGAASLTVRAGGTCMSGGPLNTGWIIDMTRHMHRVEVDPITRTATAEMGAYFRDIEDAAKAHGLMFAAYPSSHRLCGIGGMIGNNASGEKSLRGGATSENVLELEVVLADGSVRTYAPKELSAATAHDEIALIALHKKFGAALKKAVGNVKKAASGYRLEKIIEKKQFNAIPLFVGAQGTLGIVTKAKLKLVTIPKHTELLIVSAASLPQLPKIVNTVFNFNPEALETFDINTYRRAQKYLAPHATAIRPYIDIDSELFILAAFSEDTGDATQAQAHACLEALTEKGYVVRHVSDQAIAASAWQVRRNSFTLMRDHNDEGMHAVPCIEDVIVPVSALGTFVAKLQQILKKRKINYGFHGHIGDGSLRIIPIFDFRSRTLEADIAGLMKDVFALVKKVKGNISADHSDGIIRAPYLKDFYGEELYASFEKIKKLYDPEGIMNPGKKVGVSVEFLNKSLNKG